MRRENEWVITVFSIVVFAAATAMAPKSPASSVINLRADVDERVVLPVNLAPVVVSSLPALDESSLFGIKVEPRVPEVPPPVVSDAPRRYAKLSASRGRERRLASRARGVGSVAPEVVASDVPKAMSEKADLAVVELDAPTWRPRSAVALTPDGPTTTESTILGFRLNERASLNVGPLSSMAPSYAPDARHGDLNRRWRLDEDDASQAPGAAVGMTFKLN